MSQDRPSSGGSGGGGALVKSLLNHSSGDFGEREDPSSMQIVEETCVRENDSVSMDGNRFDVPLVDAAEEYKSTREDRAELGNKWRVDISEGGTPSSRS